jgi:ParB-like chromosome segregation protein Spo0J
MKVAGRRANAVRPDHRIRRSVVSKPKSDLPQYQFHPLADVFPLMEGVEFDELVADIKANGLQQPIILYEDKILDGRNRYRACCAAGVKPKYQIINTFAFRFDTALTYVISANLRRRHLTAEQKREVIEKLLKADPEKSDRQVARLIGASPTTIGKVRKEREATGDVSKVDTSTDTKGRRQPRQRSKPATATPVAKPAVKTVVANAEAMAGQREAVAQAQQDVGATSAAELARLTARNEELEVEVRRLKIAHEAEIEDLKAQSHPAGLIDSLQAALAIAIAESNWEVELSESKKRRRSKALHAVQVALCDLIDLTKPAKAKGKKPTPAETPAATPDPVTPLANDGLDIPESLRRAPGKNLH